MNSMIKNVDWSKIQRRALTPTEVVTRLAQLEGWTLRGEGPDVAIEKTYQFANYYHSHAPDSLFVQRLICTMPTLDGRKTFIGNLLKVRGIDGLQELHVTSEGEREQLLQEHFGLIINDHLRF